MIGRYNTRCDEITSHSANNISDVSRVSFVAGGYMRYSFSALTTSSVFCNFSNIPGLLRVSEMSVKFSKFYFAALEVSRTKLSDT